MYAPAAFREADPSRLHALIQTHNFGTLVSLLDGELFATHLPFLLDPDRGPNGTLVAHLARANPHWRGFHNPRNDNPPAGPPALAIFAGPHAYISPRWYAAELNVPTWNYTVVHAYGVPTIVHDPARVRAILERTVASHEQPPPAGWSTERVPDEYVTRLALAIVAFEMPIVRLEGKWKLGQNRTPADVEGAVAGLQSTGDVMQTAVADLMAEQVGQRRSARA